MKTYVAIDLKSYYASAEAVARGMNPLTTNLVVADLSRTEKTICLAVSPSLKAYGIPGRARLFEVVQRVKEINAERFQRARKLGVLQKGEDGKYCFHGSSFDAEALAADPGLELAYLVAPPRMLYYEQLSTKIFSIYGRSVSPEDIHVYSIDECFIDLTPYLELSGLSAREFTMSLVRDVLFATGVTATAGIGTNMYLAKIAMDIVAKHVPADKDGVRIAELDERSYREQLWCHRPLTDFWRVGPGIARRLEKHGLFTMGDVARQSVRDEDVLYKEFGVNAELLIDHAWGWEPSDMQTVRNYRPETTSLSSGQVLAEGYPFDRGPGAGPGPQGPGDQKAGAHRQLRPPEPHRRRPRRHLARLRVRRRLHGRDLRRRRHHELLRQAAPEARPRHGEPGPMEQQLPPHRERGAGALR